MMMPTVVEICGKPGQRTVAFAAPKRSRGWPVVAMRACSACAGDYEDPDRATDEAGEEIEEGPPRGQEDLPAADEKEFPAEKN
jgi:hypothetical protein